MTCIHLDRCGGCPLMALPADEQLARKHALVRRALDRFVTLQAVEVGPVVRAEPDLGYRTRLKWMTDGARLGMYERGGGHRVVDTPGCLVASPLLKTVADSIRAAMPIAAFEAVDLREVESPDGPRVLVTLVTSDRARERSLREFATGLQERHPSIVGVAMNVRGRRSPQVLGRETIRLVGEEAVRDRLGRAHVFATFGSFVQAHRRQARAISEAVADRVSASGARPRVLELFGGSGALGFELAARGATVDLVEAFGPAVELARRAAAEQGFAVSAYAADAERFTLDAVERGEVYDVVLVDPPRRGLTPGLRDAITRLSPRWIAYVSCHPTTFARDLDHLASLGFACRDVAPFDMIPQTEEVESLAFLEAAPPPELPVLRREFTMTVLDRPPHLEERTVWRRAASQLGTSAFGPSSRHAPSGATPVAAVASAVDRLPTELVVLAKGTTTTTGAPHGLRYRRLAICGGHSLLLLEVEGTVDATLARLADTGHPAVAGLRCDPATTRHFVEKHALDRAFVHRSAVRLPDGTTVRAPLAGDLVATLASLGFDWDEACVASTPVTR